MTDTLTGLIIIALPALTAGFLVMGIRVLRSPEWRWKRFQKTGNPDWIKKGYWG